MTQKPVNLSLYFEVQEVVRPQSTVASLEPAKLSKSGSAFCPQFPKYPENDYDQVYPKLYLGNAKIVKDGKALKSMGITHMVNLCMGPKFNQVNTSKDFYKEFNIEFHGVPAMDTPSFQLLPYLNDTAAFIEQALSSGGTVYVHCQQGVSRSATAVLAFFMLYKDMDLLMAAKLLRSKREVTPNNGFLRQLCELQEEIDLSKGAKTAVNEGEEK